MISAMEIRPARPADVPAVLPMVSQIAALHERWDPAKYGYVPDPATMYQGWLTSNADNARAIRFYQRNGFADAGEVVLDGSAKGVQSVEPAQAVHENDRRTELGHEDHRGRRREGSLR